MTVGELIAELQRHPPGALAVVNMGKNELGNGREVAAVRPVASFSSLVEPGDWFDADFASDHPDDIAQQTRAVVVNVTS